MTEEFWALLSDGNAIQIHLIIAKTLIFAYNKIDQLLTTERATENSSSHTPEALQADVNISTLIPSTIFFRNGLERKQLSDKFLLQHLFIQLHKYIQYKQAYHLLFFHDNFRESLSHESRI